MTKEKFIQERAKWSQCKVIGGVLGRASKKDVHYLGLAFYFEDALTYQGRPIGPNVADKQVMLKRIKVTPTNRATALATFKEERKKYLEWLKEADARDENR